MAEKKDPHGKRSAPRKQDPVFSHLPDADVAGEQSVPAVLRRPAAKAKKSWFQQNQVLVIGLAAGVGVLLILLVIGLASGMFGTGSAAKPSAPAQVAAQPAAPPPPAAPPAQRRPAIRTDSARTDSARTDPAGADQPPPTRPMAARSTPEPSHGGGFSAARSGTAAKSVSPGKTPCPAAKKGEPKKEQKPLVPDDVAKWKPADYILARRNNDPKLLEAITRLGEKYPGNEKAARCLVDLLKPLPPEKPAAAASPAGTPAAAGIPQPQPGGNGAPAFRRQIAGNWPLPHNAPPYNPAANCERRSPGARTIRAI